ncbi:MAG TPA: hypothetical protein VFB07_08420 [Vicinamibacterales bacterium]|nr:hypothetical protein [Vicinamibacterales bacterium]
MLRPATALLAPILAFCCACSHTPTAPDSLGSASSPAIAAVTARIQPGTVSVTPIAGSACPGVPPFTSSLTLSLQSQSPVPMRVDQVTFTFLDGSNVSSHPITFPNGQLVPAGSTVSLPFSPRFGCDIARPQFVVADVLLMDGRGAAQTVSVRAPTK